MGLSLGSTCREKHAPCYISVAPAGLGGALTHGVTEKDWASFVTLPQKAGVSSGAGELASCCALYDHNNCMPCL